MPATVTRNVTSAPSAQRPWKPMAKALCKTRSMASPASVAMKAGGAASSRRVNSGDSAPKPSARAPTMMPAVYCECLRLPEEMMALTGPVRHVDTHPTKAQTMEPAPQATAIALIGGV